jgi:hypothetical protein
LFLLVLGFHLFSDPSRVNLGTQDPGHGACHNESSHAAATAAIAERWAKKKRQLVSFLVQENKVHTDICL